MAPVYRTCVIRPFPGTTSTPVWLSQNLLFLDCTRIFLWALGRKAVKEAKAAGATRDNFEKEMVWHVYKNVEDAGVGEQTS